MAGIMKELSTPWQGVLVLSWKTTLATASCATMSVFSRRLGPHNPPWRAAVLVAATAFALYLPSLGGQFIYDSSLQVGLDDYIHQPGNFAEVVSLRVLSMDEIDRNRPVQLASLMIDASVWGKNPFGFRLTSALLHAATGALLFLAAVRLMGARSGASDLAALIGALFFVLHPLCVETVCEPSNREDLLAGFFLLLGLVIFVGPPAGLRTTAFLRGAAVVVCCFLSAGSKEVGWISPFVLAAAWWFVLRPRHGAQQGDLVTLVACFAAVGLLASLITLLKPARSEIFLFAPEPWEWSRWADLQPEILAGQIERIVFPLRLCADYYRENLAPWSVAWLWLLPVVFAVGGAAFAWRWRASRTGIALFILALLPSANLIGQFNPLADRFLYLPLAGFVLALVPPLSSAVARIRRPIPRAFAVALLAVLLSSFVLRTVAYQRVWDNERALWDATLACNPRSWNALLGAGVARFEADEVSAAGPFWSEMLRRQPNDGVSLMLAALLEERQGNPREADRLFARALKAEPALAEPARFARYYGWRPRMRAVLDSLLARARL